MSISGVWRRWTVQMRSMIFSPNSPCGRKRRKTSAIMWEIYAYQNSDSLFGVFNAIAAILGSSSYQSAVAAVAFCGFVAALALFFGSAFVVQAAQSRRGGGDIALNALAAAGCAAVAALMFRLALRPGGRQRRR